MDLRVIFRMVREVGSVVSQRILERELRVLVVVVLNQAVLGRLVLGFFNVNGLVLFSNTVALVLNILALVDVLELHVFVVVVLPVTLWLLVVLLVPVVVAACGSGASRKS